MRRRCLGRTSRFPGFNIRAITSAVALAKSGRKGKRRKNLNVILHNVSEPTSDNGNCREKKEDIE